MISLFMIHIAFLISHELHYMSIQLFCHQTLVDLHIRVHLNFPQFFASSCSTGNGHYNMIRE